MDSLQVDKSFSKQALPIDLQLRKGKVLPVSVFTDDAEAQEACHFVLAAERLLSATILSFG